MGYTKEYLEWLEKKRMEGEEVLDELTARLGSNAASFGWMTEFAKETLAEAIEHARGRPPRWDAFLSYAGEHEYTLAVPLAEELRKRGCKVWIDHERILTPPDGKPGGILYRFIHEGIALSRVGIVVVSPEYLVREWTRQEYFGLRLKGVSNLFFVLHDEDGGTLRNRLPDLAADLEQARARVASTARNSIGEIALQIAEFIEIVAKSSGTVPPQP